MPRIFEHGSVAPTENLEEDRSTITATRLVAFAITALIISFVVVERTSVALEAGAATPSSAIRSGSVNLADDDEGRTMFDLAEMLPGHPLQNCISVEYTGTEFDGVVGLRARGGGELARFTDVEILVGTGGSFGDCSGFRRNSTLYEGTLADLFAQHGPDGSAIPAITIGSAHETRAFQVTFGVRDVPEAQGLDASVDFQWNVRS